MTAYDTPENVVRTISERYLTTDVSPEELAAQLNEEGVPSVALLGGRYRFAARCRPYGFVAEPASA